jgi:uncharacterized secreted protein with C-terminal beta-propeller domain
MKGRLALVAVAATAATAVGVAYADSPTSPAAGRPSASESADSPALASFSSCTQLLRYAKTNALRLVGPYGLAGGGFRGVPLPAVEESAAGAEPPAAPPPSDPGGVTSTPDFSGTNVQEEGVDEPDIVKTNGDIVFAVAQGKINAVDVSGPVPVELGSLPLPDGFGHQLLLHGDRLLVIANTGGFILQDAVPVEAAPARTSSIIAPEIPSTILADVDVSDPAAMRLVRTIVVESSFVGARLTGSTARVVVVEGSPILPFVYPESGEPGDVAAATRRNRALIRATGVGRWLPSYSIVDHQTGRTTRRALLRCNEVQHPADFSGLGNLTVMTLDLDQGIEPVDSDAVMAGGEIVYASQGRLYVATQRWIDPLAFESPDVLPPSLTTAIHSFDASTPGQTEYRASGEVDGYLLNQWSLSEQDGLLRVVSTDGPLWWGGEESESNSAVTVLAERGGRLATIGRVDGLGRGERVYAVRFIGDLGYVVTFRQVDPLHVIDLSDPTKPVVRGELEIPGYSAYLHPIGDGLLVGIGQDATSEGRVLGTQVSVFNVTNPDAPVRVQHLLLGEGWSEAEFDHHAFLFWPPSGLAVLPLETFREDVFGVPVWAAGAVALHVGPGGILELGTIMHEPWPAGDVAEAPYPAAIHRTLVAGDGLYTLSDRGLKASDLVTLTDRGWVPFS